MSFTALNILVAARLLATLHAPLQDCDETFNYLEPLNFITRGFGKETWEYSPEFAIRSYAYLLPLMSLLKPLSYFTDVLQLFPSYWLFYTIRIVIAAFTVYSEYTLYDALYSTIKTKAVANWYLLFTLIATGPFHAGVALLPSNLAMNCTTLATAALLKFTHGKKTRHALLSTKWLIIGALWGWPFVGALGLPLVIYVLAIASGVMLHRYILWSLTALFFNLVLVMQIDYSFYHKTMVVPLNIVFYNVFNAGEGKGPEIFGVEDLSYYIYNLLLNFNFIAVLAYVGIVAIPVLSCFRSINDTGLGLTQIAVTLSGLPLWSIIFFTQPHKEERFMFPVYSLINLSAAVMAHFAFNTLSAILKSLKFNSTFGKFIKKCAIYFTIILIAVVSITKTIALSQNYVGYTLIWKNISQLAVDSSNADDQHHINVCTGREWHHYPSSFFLPPQYRLKFTKSAFDGLLPGDFLESESLFNGVRAIPSGMNDLNEWDEGKVTPLKECDYFVDVKEAVDEEIGEIDLWNSHEWDLVKEATVIDPMRSQGLAKLLYVPECVVNVINQLDGEIGEKLNTVVGNRALREVGLFRRRT